ncbi:MAG: hypothetical protein HY719_00650 [Planctomycetes bacterium]|nr:hypothetical protein [Planctomycetota bacterium]
MSFFRKLFKKSVRARDVRVELARRDRRRRKSQARLRRMEARQETLIHRVKKARQRGDGLEVDFLWEELAALRQEMADERAAARLLHLEHVALKKYAVALERLESGGRKESIRRLIERIKAADLDGKLAAAQVDDEDYYKTLAETLDDVGPDLAGLACGEADPDPDKSRFLDQIDAIVAAEEEGAMDEALRREEALRDSLETPAPPGEEKTPAAADEKALATAKDPGP